jgi:hypothetical protein
MFSCGVFVLNLLSLMTTNLFDMKQIIIALIIGIVAGIVDIVPMIIQKLEKRASLSAFTHWVFLGLIIPFVNWGIQSWLKGLIIGILASIPVLIIITDKDKKSMVPVLLFSAVLGIGVALAGAKFIS